MSEPHPDNSAAILAAIAALARDYGALLVRMEAIEQRTTTEAILSAVVGRIKVGAQLQKLP